MSGLNCMHLRLHVVRPVLERLRLSGLAAENLVLGIAAHESGGFHHLRQLADGPALGLYQCEPATHHDLFANFLRHHADLYSAALALRAAWPDPDTQLVTNLAYATAVCRLQIYRAKPKLPAADDVAGLAAYWKRFWNTAKGRGTEEQFIAHYREFVR